MEAIKSSSEMHQFCKDTALKMLTFFNSDAFPVLPEDAENFYDVISEEIVNIQNEVAPETE